MKSVLRALFACAVMKYLTLGLFNDVSNPFVLGLALISHKIISSARLKLCFHVTRLFNNLTTTGKK